MNYLYRYEFILRKTAKTITTIIGDLPDAERVEDEIVEKYRIAPKDILIAIRGIVRDGKLLCLPCKENELKTKAELELGACEACMERMSRKSGRSRAS